jgi:hypothetical protein
VSVVGDAKGRPAHFIYSIASPDWRNGPIAESTFFTCFAQTPQFYRAYDRLLTKHMSKHEGIGHDLTLVGFSPWIHWACKYGEPVAWLIQSFRETTGRFLSVDSLGMQVWGTSDMAYSIIQRGGW